MLYLNNLEASSDSEIVMSAIESDHLGRYLITSELNTEDIQYRWFATEINHPIMSDMMELDMSYQPYVTI